MSRVKAINIPGRARGEEFECSEGEARVYSTSGMGEVITPKSRMLESPVNRMLDTGGSGESSVSQSKAKKRRRLAENR